MESLLLYEIRRKQSSSVSKLAELAHILLNTKFKKVLKAKRRKLNLIERMKYVCQSNMRQRNYKKCHWVCLVLLPTVEGEKKLGEVGGGKAIIWIIWNNFIFK